MGRVANRPTKAPTIMICTSTKTFLDGVFFKSCVFRSRFRFLHRGINRTIEESSLCTILRRWRTDSAHFWETSLLEPKSRIIVNIYIVTTYTQSPGSGACYPGGTPPSTAAEDARRYGGLERHQVLGFPASLRSPLFASVKD